MLQYGNCLLCTDKMFVDEYDDDDDDIFLSDTLNTEQNVRMHCRPNLNYCCYILDVYWTSLPSPLKINWCSNWLVGHILHWLISGLTVCCLLIITNVPRQSLCWFTWSMIIHDNCATHRWWRHCVFQSYICLFFVCPLTLWLCWVFPNIVIVWCHL